MIGLYSDYGSYGNKEFSNGQERAMSEVLNLFYLFNSVSGPFSTPYFQIQMLLVMNGVLVPTAIGQEHYMGKFQGIDK